MNLTEIATEAEQAPICLTCGTLFPFSKSVPNECPICEDDRQYVGLNGQQWTTLAAMRGRYHNRFTTLEPGLTSIVTEPAFAIGQRAYLIQTPQGNILWETLTYIDETTIASIERLGGCEAIAISHPHYYATMAEWSRRLGGIPIYLHEDNRPWVMNPDNSVHYWDSETFDLIGGLTLIRTGGHFPGSQVLHWPAGADGQGVLLSGDNIQIVRDRGWVTFMYSYPNVIPLDAASVRRIVASVEPYPYARLYGAFQDQPVVDAKNAVIRSADRYIRHVQGGKAGRDFSGDFLAPLS
jgi:glyoxylase-like metal-dependent hydrolase (beta-lactamase superfamily II)